MAERGRRLPEIPVGLEGHPALRRQRDHPGEPAGGIRRDPTPPADDCIHAGQREWHVPGRLDGAFLDRTRDPRRIVHPHARAPDPVALHRLHTSARGAPQILERPCVVDGISMVIHMTRREGRRVSKKPPLHGAPTPGACARQPGGP